MPYRCKDCQFIGNSEANPECQTPHNCSFEKIELIHYASTEGKGRIVGRGYKVSSGENQEEAVQADVRLHCSNQSTQAQFTNGSGVTCTKCLKTLPVQKEQEELDNGSDS